LKPFGERRSSVYEVIERLNQRVKGMPISPFNGRLGRI